MLVDSGRSVETDKKFEADQRDTTFINRQFVRLVANKRKFTGVDFRYSTFEASYLRDCQFDSCNFIGCRFVGSNLHGSKFSGCKFGYAVFERTLIESDILDTECPSEENLKARFARSLRTNFQQLGDADAANKAMRVELQATETHLLKEWQSNESYYRKKYKGLIRLKSFIKWMRFRVLDFIWGNGEDAYRLVRFAIIVLCLMAIYDAAVIHAPWSLQNAWGALLRMPEVFLGVTVPADYPKWYVALVTIVRLVVVGFLLAIVVKRFNRR